MNNYEEIKKLLKASRTMLSDQKITESVNEIKKIYSKINEQSIMVSAGDITKKINLDYYYGKVHDSKFLEKMPITEEKLVGDTYFIMTDNCLFSCHKNFWEPFKREKKINLILHSGANPDINL